MVKKRHQPQPSRTEEKDHIRIPETLAVHFAQAVLQAINLGGDTDTIGAMTGAISGAYLGFDSIPSRRRDKLENRFYSSPYQLGGNSQRPNPHYGTL